MFRQLKMYYLVIALPFALLLTGAAIFFDAIKTTITRNPHPQINYTIFVIILVGGITILLNARRLVREARVLVEYFGAIHAKTDLASLQKMANGYTGDTACLLQMVAASSGRSISHQEQVAIEHELTNARARLVRRNALPQYLTGLLVGMGLLGTFIGLLATLNDISVLISSFADLDMQNASPLLVFRTMIERMKAPMQSMGIAFSASMFGLLGSIILGLMMVGIRRLQGDIFSLMSSEIARHIEIALSYESLTFKDGKADVGDVAKVLIRIEERYAEAARSQQRALSALIAEMKDQRADVLRALTAQTEASTNFRGELQQLGRQLGSVFGVMEKGSDGISSQISELTVQMAGATKETHKLLAAQVDEQKRLRDTLDSYNLEERLTEAARLQQRALSAEIDDFKKQRSDMLRTLAEQVEASNGFRGELQQVGRQLGSIFNAMENDMLRILGEQAEVSKSVRQEVQQLGGQLGTIANVMENEMLRTLADQAGARDDVRSELRQLGSQLDSICQFLEKGNEELATQISDLTVQLTGNAKEARKLLALQVEEQKGLKGTLDSYNIEERLAEAARLQQRALSTEIDDFQKQRADMLRTLTEQIEASNSLRGELQQLGSQLGNIFHVMEKGNGEISTQITELMVHRAADAKESHKLLSMLLNDQGGMLVNESKG